MQKKMQELDLTQTQRIGAALLTQFARFCAEHNLHYYLAYGTLLGAARHGGFIPWDDDVDVWMPRRDYERLLNLRNQMPKSAFLIADRDRESIWPFHKWCATHTYFYEVSLKSRSPEKYGIFIDIFPLDRLNPIAEGRKNAKKITLLSMLFRVAYATDLASSPSRLKYYTKRLVSPILRVIPSITYRQLIRKISIEFEAQQSTQLIDYFNYSYLPLSKSFFDLHDKLSFCDEYFVVPKNYAEILEIIYGKNWRVPLKRVADVHGKAYIQDGWTVDSVVTELTKDKAI